MIDWQIEHDIYQGFLQYAHEPGEAGTELIPCLATEVPSVENGGISADGTVYTFHLREGVRFQPPVSREVTAADFKYSFERMMREPRAPATSFYMGVVGAGRFMKGKADEITGYKVVDDSTVEVTLESPDLSFLNAITMDFCDVVPREWVEKWGSEFNRNPLGTGPFVFQKWTPGQEIVLTRNPDYWEEGKPYLDGVNYQLSFNPPTALLKLERGEVDVLGDGVPVADIPRVKADPKLSELVYSQPLVAISYMFMNAQMEPFNDVKVRQALSWAINRDKLVKLQAGQAVSLWQFYPQGMPGHVQDKVYYGYDPAKAKQLLAEAGYPDGFETMLYTDNVDPNPKLWQSVQADLAASRCQGRPQDHEQQHVLHAAEHAQDAHRRQLRLVDGLPGPERLDPPAVQQVQCRGRRHELELLVEPPTREDVRQSAGHDRPRGTHRQVLRDAGPDRRGGAVRAVLPARPDDDVLGDHGRLLPAPRVPDRPDAILEEVADEARARPPAASCRSAPGRSPKNEETQRQRGCSARPQAAGWVSTSSAGCSGWWWCSSS